ncbi:hypothetical protein J5N97_025018 [Dioscorea zingiberensis]|uniref:RRM domain-containing protein n=1 Tax=Dioscorea zingiberensis TaxID=325984 RepID=A0A9D5H952_9LILI|nr:hypothetical protein J5N97_025018 [Dioscorea zingiberensis]
MRVSNVSLSATEKDVQEFFSFSGDIECIEMDSADEWSQIAYVTFKDPRVADTALLLLGASIVDLSVMITPAPDYQIPPHAALIPTMDVEKDTTASSESAVQKAEDVLRKLSSGDEGSAILKSRYVFTGASLVTGAFNKVAKAATDVGSKTKEKVAAVQHQNKEGTGE